MVSELLATHCCPMATRVGKRIDYLNSIMFSDLIKILQMG